MDDFKLDQFWEKVREINTQLSSQLKEADFMLASGQEFEYPLIIADVANISGQLTGITTAFENGSIPRMEAMLELTKLQESIKEVSLTNLFNVDEVERPKEEKPVRKIDDSDFSF